LANLVKQFRNQRGRYEVDEFCDQFRANPKSLYFLRGITKLVELKGNEQNHPMLTHGYRC
jgi:hypothetical protein